MKEYTTIINAQITAIGNASDDSEPVPPKRLAEYIKSKTGADDVVVTDVKVFEMEKERKTVDDGFDRFQAGMAKLASCFELPGNEWFNSLRKQKGEQG